MNKNANSPYFENFYLNQKIIHPTPKTITIGDTAIYNAIYGNRFIIQADQTFAQNIGYIKQPIDDLLLFHIVFGKTVPDISVNAVANLGYAQCAFIRHAYTGDTIRAESEIIGIKENSNKKAGIIYVKTRGYNQNNDAVIEYIRWVMVKKKNQDADAPNMHIPDIPNQIKIKKNIANAPPKIISKKWNTELSGSKNLWQDYKQGEKIDHINGITIEEAEHMIATRLFQNNANVHFNLFQQKQNPPHKRLIYGGHVISLARALSFNGLQNTFHIFAINNGKHTNPIFAQDTIFAWSEILETTELPHRNDIGALRIRTVATKNQPCENFPYKQNIKQNGEEKSVYHDNTILDIDYWAAIPKRIKPE